MTVPISQRGAGWINRRVESQPAEILPDLWNDSPKYHKFIRAIAEHAEKEFPAALDDLRLAGPNAVPGNFNKIRSLTGFKPDRQNLPPKDNNKFIEEKGLSQIPTRQHEDAIREVFALMFKYAKPCNYSLNRDSNMMYPTFLNVLPEKMELIKFVFSNIDKMIELIKQDNITELHELFMFTYVYTLVSRFQPNSGHMLDGKLIMKDILLHDYEAAFNNGPLIAMDRSIKLYGNYISDMVAQKWRTAYAGSGVPNTIGGVAMKQFDKYFSNEYEFTWKHRTSSEILEKMNRFKYHLFMDAETFDQTIPGWGLDIMCEELGKSSSEWFGKMTRKFLSGPYLAAGYMRDKRCSFFSDDPWDPTSYNYSYGIPSGIFAVSTGGKGWAMGNMNIVKNKYFPSARNYSCHELLRGECPTLGFLNMGDDTVLMSNDENEFNKVKEELDNDRPITPYLKLGIEDGGAFLGRVAFRDNSGNLGLVPNPVTFLANRLSPEEGIEERSRRHRTWALGFKAAMTHYLVHDTNRGLNEILKKHYFDTTGNYLSAMVRKAETDIIRSMGDLTSVEAEFVEEPQRIHYRIDPDDIRPELLKMYIKTFMFEDIEEIVYKIIPKNRFLDINQNYGRKAND